MEKIKHIKKLKEITYHGNLPKSPFAAYIMTSWQLDNLIACIRTLKLEPGILIIGGSSDKKNGQNVTYRLTEKQVFIYEQYFSHIFFCSNSKNDYYYQNLFKSLYRKKTTALKFIYPRPQPSLRLISFFISPSRQLHFVEIDEGLSSYFSFGKALKIVYGTGVKQWLIRQVVFYKQQAINLICKFFFFDKRIQSTLFVPKKEKLIPNKKICSNLKKIYEERCINSILKNTVIIFKDYHVINDEKAIDIFDEILKELSKHSNLNIIIKKHPHDTDSFFDTNIKKIYPSITIIQNTTSGEELIAAYQPLFIIGGCTTVIFSSAFIFNIPAISYMMIYKEFKEYKSSFPIDVLYDKFNNNENIHFAKSYNEIHQNINKQLFSLNLI